MRANWIPLERVERLIEPDILVLILALAAGSYVFYKALLKDVSEERHRAMRARYFNLAIHCGAAVALFFGFRALEATASSWPDGARWAAYVGVLALLSGATVVVRTFRILVFEFLFIGHMKVGVPVLLVNLSTLLVSIFVYGWVVTEVFAFQIAPLLATSAVLSLVLGLAVQDTLGNLFAGVSLQLDKPYEIGDWVEITAGQKWVGQIQEINWRATLLVGIADEQITIPNRVIAQAQIANYSAKSMPFCRVQIFRIPYGSDYAKAKRLLTEAALAVPSVRKNPSPITIFAEAGEHGVSLKLVYFIESYGSQYVIADQVIDNVLTRLADAGIHVAPPRLAAEVTGASSPRAS